MQFVDVILPIPIPQLFTYSLPNDLYTQIQIGARVIVPFGKRKVLTAVIAKIHQNPPQHYTAKPILEVLDIIPSVTQIQVTLMQWMADYYMCCVGEVLNVALPSGLKISSLSKIQIRPDVMWSVIKLTEQEQKLIQSLKKNEDMSYDEASEALGVENVYHIIKSLIAKEVILVFEEIREKYQPKIQKRIRLTSEYITETNLKALTKKLEKYPKQQDIYLAYLKQVPVFRDWTLNEEGCNKEILTKDITLSNSALQTLLKNAVFEEFEVIISRFEEYDANKEIRPPVLSLAQKKASEEILDFFATKDTVLLHGVTGSGKTEIYIDLIQKVLVSGAQVLFLLPEIALTTQIVLRLRKIFGNQMGVYHSKFSDNERVEIWQGVRQGKINFVVGVRSSIFLPFDNLGLIIVDEEHETSYKQHDPAPRYHARDMALVIGKLQNCKILLASATPSVETFYQAQQGKYGWVSLKERYGEALMPEISLVDLTQERKQKHLKGHFSQTLLDAMQTALQKNEQIILFQNRRGYSPYMACKDCNYIPKCSNCAVSLTYHMGEYELRCHYCGHIEPPPKKCPACQSVKIETVGLGTEKLEDDIKLFFPQARTQRMDLDTTRTKNAYQQIIQSFENHEVDILIGTQMISKGLDFDKVSLVGIFDADRLLHFPDFRAHERAYQMLTQVSGRAGRKKDSKGKVLIQTNDVEQSLLHKVVLNDYEAMYAIEIEERAYFYYPPFTRLIKITTKHINRGLSLESANFLAQKLMSKLGKARVLGPEAPLIHKIRNKFLFNILIKIERENIDLKTVKKFIYEQVEDILTEKAYKQVQISVDVDPL